MRPATWVVARAATWPLAPLLVAAVTVLLLRRPDAAGPVIDAADLPFGVATLICWVVGVVLTWRVPGQVAGWAFLGLGTAIAWSGQTVAESRQPTLLFETYLPTRYYLPAQDVNQNLLSPSETRSACAYKGIAEYWAAAGESRDVAWTYRQPLHDAAPVKDMIAFFNERVDITVDGQPQERPRTPWS